MIAKTLVTIPKPEPTTISNLVTTRKATVVRTARFVKYKKQLDKAVELNRKPIPEMRPIISENIKPVEEIKEEELLRREIFRLSKVVLRIQNVILLEKRDE